MKALTAIAELWVSAVTDGVAICTRMSAVVLQIAAIYGATMLVWFTAPRLMRTDVGTSVEEYLILLACAYVGSPYFVALHRFIATGEVRSRMGRRDYDGALVYTAWSAVILLVQFGPMWILADLGATPKSRLAGFGFLVGVSLSSYFIVRFATLLPMAALAPETATRSAAMRQTRRRFWFTFTAVGAATLPAVLGYGILWHGVGLYLPRPLFIVLTIADLLALQLLPLSVSTRLFLRFRAEARAAPFPPGARSGDRS